MKYILSIFLMAMSLCNNLMAQEDCRKPINIWEGANTHLNVKMIPYIASGDNNIAVIICPGGSYFWHDMNAEGHEVAEWLQKNGISAFVLKYRTAHVPAYILHYRLLFRGNRYPDPQDDLKQAIKYLKANAQKYCINAKKIGTMGFSAGGHLAMSSAELFDKTLRPAFVAPIYPVVTMEAGCVHKRSRRALLGDNRKKNKELQNLLSLENHVTEDSSPVFLVNCNDDPIVNYRNSELLDSALTSKKIPHKYIQYSTGGHGFGGSNTKGTEECRKWKNEFINWIKNLNL